MHAYKFCSKNIQEAHIVAVLYVDCILLLSVNNLQAVKTEWSLLHLFLQVSGTSTICPDIRSWFPHSNMHVNTALQSIGIGHWVPESKTTPRQVVSLNPYDRVTP